MHLLYRMRNLKPSLQYKPNEINCHSEQNSYNIFIYISEGGTVLVALA